MVPRTVMGCSYPSPRPRAEVVARGVQKGWGVKNSGSPRCALPPHPEFLESLEPDLPALRALGLRLWAAGPETHPAGISDLLAEASAEVDEPVPGYLSAPQSIMDTCLYIFTSGTTGEPWTYLPEMRGRQGAGNRTMASVSRPPLQSLPAPPP